MNPAAEEGPDTGLPRGEETAVPNGVDPPTFGGWLLFALASPLIWLLRVIPLRWALGTARLLADVSFGLGFFREVPKLNLEYVFPEKTAKERKRIAWLANRSTFQMAVEFIAYLNPKRKALDNVEIDDLDLKAVAGAVAQGRGILLVVAHSSNMDITGRVWTELGYEAQAVVKPLKSYYWNRFLLTCRAANGYGVISTKDPDVVSQINAVIQRGGAVGLFPDQNARQRGIVCDFLGKPASTYKGPAATYLELKPVLLVAVNSRPHSNHRHLLRLRVLEDMPLSGDREQDLVAITTQINDTMSEFLMLDPTAYMWAHRRWGRYRDGTWVAG